MKKLFALVVVTTVIAFAAWAAYRRSDPVWTTCCEEARAELEQGLEASRRFYHDEAYGHFRAAVDIDPQFVIAKLLLLQNEAVRDRDRSALIAFLEAVDPEPLNPRERLLVEVATARIVDQDPQRVGSVLEAYLERHPDDPYALEISCDRAWMSETWEQAEACYHHLLQVDPNWISAQNRLGYLALAQGRFEDAEERFRTYRYIAPDQANPHDSLGELLMVQGRWDEAEASLLSALETRPDFCISWANLSDIGLYRDDLALARARLEQARASEACRDSMVRQWCRVSLSAVLAGEQVLDDAVRDTCLREDESRISVEFRLAVAAGDLELAQQLETELAALPSRYAPDKEPPSRTVLEMEALRAMATEDWHAAERALGALQADLAPFAQLEWFTLLRVELAHARALRELGRNDEADLLEKRATSVNPSFSQLFRDRCTEPRNDALPLHVLCPRGVVR